jgi:hypothetical protein
MAVVAIAAVLVLIWRHRPGETEDLSVQMTSVSSLVEVTSEIEPETPIKHVVRKPATRKPAARISSKKTLARKPAARKTVAKKPIAKKSSS